MTKEQIKLKNFKNLVIDIEVIIIILNHFKRIKSKNKQSFISIKTRRQI